MCDEYFSLNRISDNEFLELKKSYEIQQKKYKDSFLFHVGVGAGFYSEVGGMLEAMMYSYYRQFRFVLYADDANFTNNNGWTALFEEFCEMNHSKLNIHANNRGFQGGKIKVTLQNIMNIVLKVTSGCRYTTRDWWLILIGAKFKETVIDWDIFDIHGTVRNEYAKLSKLAIRCNTYTWNKMVETVNNLKLPSSYISVHLRGGDKIMEIEELISVETCISVVEQTCKNITNIFVFTDDYGNVEELYKKRPNWNIYTLTKPEEKGYYNHRFNECSWSYKRDNLIKLFTIVEICIGSQIHYGDEFSCVNNFIYSRKIPGHYISLRQECVGDHE